MTDYEMKRNASGYTDLTAYNGIKNADYAKEKERHRKLIGALLRICEHFKCNIGDICDAVEIYGQER